MLGEDQKNIYSLTPVENGLHQVRKGDDGKIHIETSSDALSIHEITHVRQSLNAGGLKFSSGGLLLNVGSKSVSGLNSYESYKLISEMEVEAYKMQYSLDQSFPGSVNGIQGIDVHAVGNIRFNGKYVYGTIHKYSNYLKVREQIEKGK